MVDRPDAYVTRGTTPTTVAERIASTVHSAESGPGRSGPGAGRPVLVRLGAVASVAGIAGLGAVGGAGSGSLLVGMLIATVGLLAVVAVLVVGFTWTMVRFAAEGRRRATGVADVAALMSGTAEAYGQVFGSLTSLLRGASADAHPEATEPAAEPERSGGGSGTAGAVGPAGTGGAG